VWETFTTRIDGNVETLGKLIRRAQMINVGYDYARDWTGLSQPINADISQRYRIDQESAFSGGDCRGREISLNFSVIGLPKKQIWRDLLKFGGFNHGGQGGGSGAPHIAGMAL
jgi:hypothetical protein